MTDSSKNHTISKIVAKSIFRLFVVIIIIFIAFYLNADQSRLESTPLYFQNKWVIAFPVILLLLYSFLLITVQRNKYKHPEINWLFTLSGIFIIAYLLLLMSRIYPFL